MITLWSLITRINLDDELQLLLQYDFEGPINFDSLWVADMFVQNPDLDNLTTSFSVCVVSVSGS